MLAVPAEVRDQASVRALFARTKRRLVALTSSSTTRAPGAPALPPDLTYRTVEGGPRKPNLSGAFLCTQAAIKLMKDQTPRGGRIVNNGSISATHLAPTRPHIQRASTESRPHEGHLA